MLVVGGLVMGVSVAGPRASEGLRVWVGGSWGGCEGGMLVVVAGVAAGSGWVEAGCED